MHDHPHMKTDGTYDEKDELLAAAKLIIDSEMSIEEFTDLVKTLDSTRPNTA
jgi:hypothetical protein